MIRIPSVLALLLLVLSGCGGGGGEGEVEGELLAFRRIAARESSGQIHDTAFVALIGNSSSNNLFGQIPLNDDDDGRVLRATSGSAFEFIRGLLMNGVSDGMTFELAVGNPLGGICTSGAPEADFFGLPPGQLDFGEFVVTAIEIEILHLDFIVPGSDPSGSDVDFEVEIRVFGFPAVV